MASDKHQSLPAPGMSSPLASPPRQRGNKTLVRGALRESPGSGGRLGAEPWKAAGLSLFPATPCTASQGGRGSSTGPGRLPVPTLGRASLLAAFFPKPRKSRPSRAGSCSAQPSFRQAPSVPLPAGGRKGLPWSSFLEKGFRSSRGPSHGGRQVWPAPGNKPLPIGARASPLRRPRRRGKARHTRKRAALRLGEKPPRQKF